MSGASAGPIERYLQIMEIVAASPGGLTLAGIVDITGLPKASAHRLTRALVEAGALGAGEGRNRTFSVGARMSRMLRLGDSDGLTGYAQLVVDDLAERLHETCYAVRLELDTLRAIARAVPDQGHSVHVFPGEVQPPHAAASAKAILAFQPDAVVERHLGRPLDRLTPETKVTAAAVRRELEEVRRTGFAVCDREIDENVMAYACPVHAGRLGVVCSLGVTGPSTRLQRRARSVWVDALKDAAARLGRMLDAGSEIGGAVASRTTATAASRPRRAASGHEPGGAGAVRTEGSETTARSRGRSCKEPVPASSAG